MAPKKTRKIQLKFIENRNHVVILLLILVDILTISLAVLLSAGIRQLLRPIMGGEINWPLIIRGLIFFAIFNLVLAWFNGLYPGFGLAAVHEMQKLLYVVSLASVFLGVFLFLQQLGQAYSRFVFVLTWFFSALFMMLGRFAIRNLFSRFDWWGIPMVIMGSQESVTPIIDKLFQNRRLGFRPVYYFDQDFESEGAIQGVDAVRSKEDLQTLVSQTKIEHLVFTMPLERISSQNFYWMRDLFPNILFVLETANFGSLWVRTIDLHGTLAIETNYHLLNKRETIIKRILDMILTIILLLFTWPLFLILALLIRLDSKGPIFYTQDRLGLNGKHFGSLKFRTMHQNAEDMLQDLLDKDPQARQEYQTYHKLSKDPRITHLGRFLRRYSLDELPQLINVLKGQMNLIGPRSYLPQELPEIGEYANIILKVKPGVTGWWQVMGRNATSFKERLQLDEYYISNWSIWLDVYIMIKTVWVLISGKGL
jgi:Undecaprenyl-phosphate galactose phosphotransferase WbaP